ncbi:MAG: hypothetical protein J0L93_10355 [Deltaproteobacteria bacterium]|nr:hypothetical protein [Deltaproteobacteria bacterium]
MSKIILVFTFIFGSITTYAGNNVGNGVPDIDDRKDAAWFTNVNEPVHYCVQTTSDSSVDLVFAKREVARAIEDWKRYIQERPGLNSPISLQTDWREEGVCDNADIHFDIGTTPSDNHVAEAVKTKIDLINGVSKGYIRVAAAGSMTVKGGMPFPNWMKPNHLFSILLHEIGHVMGCGHVDGTIMDERLVLALRFNNQERLASIDQRRILFYDNIAPLAYRGSLGNAAIGSDPGGSESNYRKLAGREARGDIRAEYFPNEALLVIDDGQGAIKVRFERSLSQTSADLRFADSSRRFYRMKEYSGGGYLITSDQNYGFVNMMRAFTPNGVITVQVYVNALAIGRDGPIGIDLVEDGKLLGLFRAAPYLEQR